MTLSAGNMDTPLVHLGLTHTQGAAGGPVKTWTEGETLWCDREQTSGSIRTASASERASTRVEWLTYWYGPLTVGERLRDEDGTLYEIEEKRPIERRAFMIIVTTTLEGRA